MSQKTKERVRLLAGIALAVTAVLAAAALAVACVLIYQSGDRPFTPDRIGAAWSGCAIFVWLFAVCAIFSGAWSLLFPAPAKKQKGTITPALRLSKVRARLARKQYPDELILPLTKHEVYLKSMQISAVAICVLSAVYPLYYLSNLDNFTSLDALLNTQVINAVVPSFCFASAALGYCCAVRILSDASCERAILYAKAIMLLPAPAAEKKPEGKQNKELPSYAILVARIALIIAAVLMIVFGIFNGGMNDVLQKAIKICTECIGLG